MTGVVTPELDASNLFDLVEVDGLNLLHALLQVGLRVQHVIGRDVTAGGQEGLEAQTEGLQAPQGPRAALRVPPASIRVPGVLPPTPPWGRRLRRPHLTLT